MESLTLTAFRALDGDTIERDSMKVSMTAQTIMHSLLGSKIVHWPGFPHEDGPKRVPVFHYFADGATERMVLMDIDETHELVCQYTAPASWQCVSYHTTKVLHEIKQAQIHSDRDTVLSIWRLDGFRSEAGRKMLVKMADEIDDCKRHLTDSSSTAPFNHQCFKYYRADILAVADLAKNSYAFDPDYACITVDFHDIIKKLPVFMDGKPEPKPWSLVARRTL